MNQYALATFLTSMMTLALGLFVFIKQSKLAIGRVFCFFSLSVVAWSFCLLLNILATDKASAIIWARFLHAFSMLIAISFLHLVFLMSGEVANRQKKLTSAYVIVLLIFCLDFTPWLASVRFLTSFGFYVAEPRFLYPVHLFVFLGVHSYAFFELIRAFVKSTGEKRSQLTYFLLATIIGYSGGITNYLINYGIKIYPFYPFGNYTIIVFVLILAFAIFRHRLMDIEVIIKKTLVYSILTILITGILFFSILLSERYFRQLLGEGSVFTLVIFAFILAVIFRPLQERIQRVVDRLFFKSKYDYRDILRVLSARTVAIIEIDKLFKIVLNTVRTTLSVDNASIYLLDEHKDLFKKH